MLYTGVEENMIKKNKAIIISPLIMRSFLRQLHNIIVQFLKNFIRNSGILKELYSQQDNRILIKNIHKG